MQVNSTARLRFVSVPPRKMRQIARLLKGMPVQRALDVLSFTPKVAARHIANTVKSAAANALSKEGTDRLRPEDLLIKDIYVDSAPTAKRIRFRSMGRVYRIRKRFCHLTVRLAGEMETEEQVARRRAEKGKKAIAEQEGKKSKGKASRTASRSKKAASKESPEGAAKTAKKARKSPGIKTKKEQTEATEAAAAASAEQEASAEATATPEESPEKPADEEPKE